MQAIPALIGQYVKLVERYGGDQVVGARPGGAAVWQDRLHPRRAAQGIAVTGQAHNVTSSQRRQYGKLDGRSLTEVQRTGVDVGVESRGRRATG